MAINRAFAPAQDAILDWLNRHGPGKPKAIFDGMKAEGSTRSYGTLISILFRMRKQGILKNIDGKYCFTGELVPVLTETLPVSKEEGAGKEETMGTLERINLEIDITELLLKKFYERKAEILETLASETGRKLAGVLNRLEQEGIL